MDNKQRNRILTVLFIGVLMGALDIAIVGPALPSIRKTFQVPENLLTWIFSIYVLFNLIGTPLMAKLSDMFGRRGIYILDVSLFALGSLVVALSGDNFTLVLIGRAIQGFGAGGIFPVASAVIGDTFPAEKRGSALGLIGAVFGLAFIVGPILGGIILGLASWHWLFLINLPIAAVVIFLAIRTLPATRPHKAGSFDWAGMGILAILLASLAYGINQIDTKNFFGSLVSGKVLPFLLVAIVLLVVLTLIERRVSHPILPGYLFKSNQIRLAYAISAGAGIGEASLVFLPLLAVAGLGAFGINEKNSSYLLMPVVLAMAVGSPMVGRFLDKFGSRLVILLGTLIMTAGMFLVGFTATTMAGFIISGALIGFGLAALLGAPIRYIMLNEAAPSERSVAQGLSTLFSSIGQLLGSAFVGAVAESRIVAGDLTSEVSAYESSFLVIAMMGVIMLALSFWLKNRAAEQETVRSNDPKMAAAVK